MIGGLPISSAPIGASAASSVATTGRAVDTQAGANSVINVLSLNSAAVDPSANSVVVTPAPNALT